MGLAKNQIHLQSTFFGRKHVRPEAQNHARCENWPVAKFWPNLDTDHFFESIKDYNENARFQPIFKFNELSLKATEEVWPSGQI